MAAFPTDSPRHPLARLSRLALAMDRKFHPGSFFSFNEWYSMLMVAAGITSERGLNDYTASAERLGFMRKVHREGMVYTGELGMCRDFLRLPTDSTI